MTFLDVTYGCRSEGWYLQPCRKDGIGWKFKPPVAGPFRTKKLALAKKRAFYEVSRGGCYSHTDCKDDTGLAEHCMYAKYGEDGVVEMTRILDKLHLMGLL